MAEEGTLQKMEVDYSNAVDVKIPECAKLAKNGNLRDATDQLVALEKQTRLAGDAISTGKLLVAIVKMCYDQKEWGLLNENIVSLTKRRGQLKQAVTRMVQEALTYVDLTEDKEKKLQLIKTLRTVTAGKIYVEKERANLTMTLAGILENEGEISEAATVLQELQVETFGSMDKREKTEFILEQMRLCITSKDFIRTQIISKKINIKYFQEPGTDDLKLKFYKLMVMLDEHDGSYLSICKHFYCILNTESIKNDQQKTDETLKVVVMYVILAPYNTEQSDLIHRVIQEKQLDEMPTFKALLDLFTTSEIINWQDLLVDQFQSVLRQEAGKGVDTKVFATNTEDGVSRWKDLKIRVVEHNIRVMAGYYTRINLSRLSQLLNLTDKETEENLSKLVVNHTVSAKIDRLKGIVSFIKTKNPNDILNDWSRNINTLMKLLDKTTHLIAKEEMVHDNRMR